MSDPIDLRNPHRKIQVGVILMGGETEILDVAPVDLLNAMSEEFVKTFPESMVSSELKKRVLDVDFHWINETGEPARLTAGARLLPTDTMALAPPLDIALMGAHNMGYQPNEVELAYVRKVHEECAHFLTICGGFMIPLSAGLLAGRKATGPRAMIPELRKMAPNVDWTEKRWQQDGKIWTSGALLNGTDMMRAWAKENISTAEAGLVDVVLDIGSYPGRDVDYRDGV